jgi:hypothetical protein
VSCREELVLTKDLLVPGKMGKGYRNLDKGVLDKKV